MLSNRLSDITPSYTISISSKINELKSLGINIIDLSIGEPDFNVPKKAKLSGINSLNENLTKYDLVPGMKILREEICKKLIFENNLDYSIDEIVVSSGAKHSITNTILALTNPGDEILIPTPYWVSYPQITKLLNCKPIFIESKKDNRFKINSNDILKNMTNKTKLLIINNPSNPTGSVYTKKELSEIVEICYKHNIYILADEIYEKIYYNNDFVSMASLSEKAKSIVITINGLSKSCAMTGLRIGYTASNKTIAKAITTIQGHLVSHPSLTSQYIAYEALNSCSHDIDNMVSIYKNRRDLICKELNSINNIDYIYPDGAFYTFIYIGSLKKHIKYDTSLSIAFCNKLLDDHHVAVVPGIAFGIDDYIRISFACNENIFLEGLSKIKNFINQLV
ncbi:pyridoxal phosphate-dependent aminotransferase [Romboutsia lituseburensis]|uniref:pyridoxal phosphate-dependent aminotransferase n=1 Tax=Romboutsia lituseburensis TaxID=1537 RepID=UPI00215A51D5|nr:pyridoxal phosphate-dependent aminotransferase [Romboutsia lituseburensis]MCR8745991.1 pyridoxal phosphate-dependent aminotransferase [Romboutsia lituseburensis]